VVVPYRTEEEIERGMATTRAVLRASVALARARGAVPLIVVPQFLPEDPTEKVLRRRILDETALPYVWVRLDPSWRLPTDLGIPPRAPQARSPSPLLAVFDKRSAMRGESKHARSSWGGVPSRPQRFPVDC
jgi:hypothetical protein